MAYQCRFPKIVEEGWFVVLSNVATSELLAIKRVKVGVGSVSRMSLVFPMTDEACEPITEVDVHLLPDCYLGLDQVMRVSVEGKGDSKGSYLRGAVENLDDSSKKSNGHARQARKRYSDAEY
jgi:hypothetical protein